MDGEAGKGQVLPAMDDSGQYACQVHAASVIPRQIMISKGTPASGPCMSVHLSNLGTELITPSLL